MKNKVQTEMKEMDEKAHEHSRKTLIHFSNAHKLMQDAKNESDLQKQAELFQKAHDEDILAINEAHQVNETEHQLFAKQRREMARQLADLRDINGSELLISDSSDSS